MRTFPGSPITLAALALALVLGLAGCSGGDDGEPPPDNSDEGTATTTTGIPTRVEVGEVAGRLGRKPARRVAQKVAAVVDGWLDAAYVGGDYPRSDFSDAFAVFTKDAAALAKRDRRLLSNAEVGDRVDVVTAKTRKLRIDVLAHKGTAAGVTGRFVLVLDLDGRRTDRIAGSLYLTNTGGKWKVFGYDVKRGRAA